MFTILIDMGAKLVKLDGETKSLTDVKYVKYNEIHM